MNTVHVGHGVAARRNIALAALCGLGLALVLALPLLASCAQSPALHGWPIAPTPAADFALTSQSGLKVSVRDFQGDLAVVTFMYSHCTTACPLISLGMRMAQDQLMPNETGRVHFLAVSVDPEGDTPENVAKFLEVRPCPQGLLWLTGSRSELQRVWMDYKVEARQVVYKPTPGGWHPHGESRAYRHAYGYLTR